MTATLVAGALIGAAAESMQALIEQGGAVRNALLQRAWDAGGAAPTAAVQLALTVGLTAVSGALVLRIAPMAAGGGVAVRRGLGLACLRGAAAMSRPSRSRCRQTAARLPRRR